MTATTTRSAAPTVALDPADEQVPFRPRRVRFDHDATADHWVPGNSFTTAPTPMMQWSKVTVSLEPSFLATLAAQ